MKMTSFIAINPSQITQNSFPKLTSRPLACTLSLSLKKEQECSDLTLDIHTVQLDFTWLKITAMALVPISRETRLMEAETHTWSAKNLKKENISSALKLIGTKKLLTKTLSSLATVHQMCNLLLSQNILKIKLSE
jgi:hypothetical protein